MPDARNSTAAGERRLVIERIFQAPRALVFAAWTKRENLQKWSAPRGFAIPSCGGDLRPGGAWHCHMVDGKGTRHKAAGVYREIVPDERLVFTHGWEGEDGKIEHETLVTVRLFDTPEGGTRMVFEQGEFASVESRDGHEDGWSQCFDKLGGLLPEFSTEVAS